MVIWMISYLVFLDLLRHVISVLYATCGITCQLLLNLLHPQAELIGGL